MNPAEESSPRPTAFVPTRWTLILRARGESPAARAALGELCEAYYAPVLAFIRSACRDQDFARDLTQEFFARLLAGHGLDTVDPNRGRFRSFLLGAVKHFLADQHDRAQAAKRGAGHRPISIQAGSDPSTSAELQIPDPSGPPTDALFDRHWAETIVERAINHLAREFTAANRTAQFEALKPWLLGNVETLSQAETARSLGMTEGAVKVAIHRLRQRFRELVKTEISQTVVNGEEVHEELKYLVEVLSS